MTKYYRTQQQLESFSRTKKHVPPPEDCEFRSSKEKQLWDHFIQARPKDKWPDSDLVLLHKLVIQETKVREHREMLMHEGDMTINQRGDPIPNPRLKVLSMYETHVATTCRLLQLTGNPLLKAEVRGQALKDKNTRSSVEVDDPLGLLAKPEQQAVN